MDGRSPIACPRCGKQMNLHAEKLEFSPPGDEGYDSRLGGVVKEFHTCPGCGATRTRVALS